MIFHANAFVLASASVIIAMACSCLLYGFMQANISAKHVPTYRSRFASCLACQKWQLYRSVSGGCMRFASYYSRRLVSIVLWHEDKRRAIVSKS